MIGMWWFKPGVGKTNFGDELGPEIVRRLGHEVKRVPIGEAELVASGSVLGLLPRQHNPGLRVWGSGFILPTDTFQARPKILAVRGALSAKKLGWTGVLGDPGVLVPLLWERTEKPTHRVGVVAHFVDKNRYNWADKVINPLDPVDTVIKQIQSCHVIASSSLHGLIVASAYNIPTIRLEHPEVIGKEFKWIDYLSAFDRKLSDVQYQLIEVLNGGE